MTTVNFSPPVCSPICLLQRSISNYNVLVTIYFCIFLPPSIISILAILIFPNLNRILNLNSEL